MRKFSMVIISIMMFILVACTNKAQVSNVEVTEVLMQDTVAPTMMTTALGMTGCANTASLPNDNEQLKIVTEVDKVVESNIETGQTGANAKITYKQEEENVVAKETLENKNGVDVVPEIIKAEADIFKGGLVESEYAKVYSTVEARVEVTNKIENAGYCFVGKNDDVFCIMTKDEARAYYDDLLSKGEKPKYLNADGLTAEVYKSVQQKYQAVADKAKAQAKAQKEAEEKAHIASLVKMLDNEIHLQNAIGSNGSVGNSPYWDGGADFGQTPLEGSALRAVNSLNPYGASGYCMRNGLVVPTGDSKRYWSSLGKSGCPARVEYSHAELEVFKINNPNYKNYGYTDGGYPSDSSLTDSHYDRCLVDYIGEDCFVEWYGEKHSQWNSVFFPPDYAR